MIFGRGCADEASEAAFSGRFCGFPHSTATRLPYGHQLTSDHVQVRQGKGGKQPSGVLRQPSVPHLAEAPEALHHVEGVLAARSGCRTQPVEFALMLSERPTRVGSAIDPVAHSVLLGGDAVQLAPVGLTPIQLPLRAGASAAG